MNTLQGNLSQLTHLRHLVKTQPREYVSHATLHPRECTAATISIVMTSHERSKQVYYTLDTIQRSDYKDVQVILVDDSTVDPVDLNRLLSYAFTIDFIRIHRASKCWSNPCINYNIGFEFVKGGQVILQNSEVCHIGDVLSYVHRTVVDHTYYVFDVIASRDFQTNDVIYQRNQLSIDIYYENLWQTWYQHYTHHNVQYHFLCAMSRATFDRIDGFSYDYAFGSGYDDNDWLLKIHMQSIPILNVVNDVHKIGGIHLFHGYQMPDQRAYVSEQNNELFEKKKRHCAAHGRYLEISEGTTVEERETRYQTLKGL